MRYVILCLTLFFIVSPIHAQASLGPGFYDQNNPLVRYPSWTWTTTNDASNYGGSRVSSGQTTTTTPKIEIDIWGDGVTLYFTKNSVSSDINICISGVCYAFDLYSATVVYMASYTFTGLGYGSHTVTVQKSSTQNEAILFDAFFVHPPTTPPTTNPVINVTLVMPTQAPTPTGTQFVYVGNFPEETAEPSTESIIVAGQDSVIRYEIRPTDIVIVVMLGMLVIIGGTGLVVRLWGSK